MEGEWEGCCRGKGVQRCVVVKCWCDYLRHGGGVGRCREKGGVDVEDERGCWGKMTA